MLHHIDTGKRVRLKDKVQRIKPNKNGNRPIGLVAWFPDGPEGLVKIRFGNNLLDCQPKMFGMKWVGGPFKRKDIPEVIDDDSH